MKLIVLFLTLCGFLYLGYFVNVRPKEYFKALDRIIIRNNKELSDQGMFNYVYGGSCFNTIRGITMYYETRNYNLSSIEDARLFIVQRIEKYLQPINNDKNIRIYLQNFPFEAKNLELAFLFLDRNGQPLLTPYIYQIILRDGNVSYFYWDPIKQKGQKIFKEEYQISYSIVQNSYQINNLNQDKIL